MINVYNSLLFVPAKNKMLSKIEKLDAEAYIIDLEDSVENILTLIKEMDKEKKENQ